MALTEAESKELEQIASSMADLLTVAGRELHPVMQQYFSWKHNVRLRRTDLYTPSLFD